MAITPRVRVAKDGTVTYNVPFRVGPKGARRQTSETFETAAAARMFVELLEAQGPEAALDALAQWQAVGADERTWTVRAWLLHHIDQLRAGAQEDTKGTYRTYVDNGLASLGALPLVTVTPDTITKWVERRSQQTYRGKPTAGKTMRNEHGFLSAAFARAVTAGVMPANPCAGTRIPRTVSEPMVFLTQGEYARFLQFVPTYWQPLVVTLFSTGLRWGEVTALQVRAIDLDARRLTVVRAWKRGRVIGVPKTTKSRRTIGLPPEVVELLRPLVEGRRPTDWVFTNRRGGPVQNATFHEQVWDPAVRLANGEPAEKPVPKGQRVRRVAPRRNAAGTIIEPSRTELGKRPRIHDTRHTCASWLLASRVPISYVQAFLGHESITTTVDRYGHILPDANEAIADALSLVLTSAHPVLELESAAGADEDPVDGESDWDDDAA